MIRVSISDALPRRIEEVADLWLDPHVLPKMQLFDLDSPCSETEPIH